MRHSGFKNRKEKSYQNSKGLRSQFVKFSRCYCVDDAAFRLCYAFRMGIIADAEKITETLSCFVDASDINDKYKKKA